MINFTPPAKDVAKFDKVQHLNYDKNFQQGGYRGNIPFYNKGQRLPWQSSGWEFAIPLQGVWVQCLVRELGSPMLCGVA